MTIRTAHDAFWYLYSHPRFCMEEISLIAVKNPSRRDEKNIFEFKHEDGSSSYYKLMGLKKRAIETNLDIFYTKVNLKGVVDDNPRKNTRIECWLEFGEYRRTMSESENNLHGLSDPNDFTLPYPKPHVLNYHDPKLDVGAPTFDEALVKLAQKVRKVYGDK